MPIRSGSRLPLWCERINYRAMIYYQTWGSSAINYYLKILFMLMVFQSASTHAQETSFPSPGPTSLDPPVNKNINYKQEVLSATVIRPGRAFAVTSGVKTGEHPFYGHGSKIGFAIDGMFGRELVLTRGETYVFDVDTSVRHDFYFSTEAKGRGAGTVTEGVFGQFVYKGNVTFTPNKAAPRRVFYACRNHKFMGGLIHIVDEGETAVLGDAKRYLVDSAAPSPLSENEIKQKIELLKDMVTGQLADRIEHGTDSSAMGLLGKARSGASVAEAALRGGNNHKALSAVESALQHAKAAIRMIPADSGMIDHHGRYVELLKHFRIYKDSYQQKYAHAKNKGDKLFAGQSNPSVFQKMNDDALALSSAGDYAAANELLAEAQSRVIIALARVYEGEQILYDKSFATAQEEFQYELARYESFEELIPIAIAKRRPSAAVIELMNGYVDKGKKIASEAKAIARANDYATAVVGLQEATRQTQRALVSAGVR